MTETTPSTAATTANQAGNQTVNQTANPTVAFAAPPAPARGSGPGPGTVALRIAGGLVALTAVVAGARSVAGEFLHHTETTTTTYPATVRSVVAASEVGSITVRAGAAGSAPQVRRTAEWSFGEPPATGRLDGQTLRLDGRCDDGGWFGGRCSIRYEITVAPETVLDLRSETGTIRAEGMAGDLRASTSTGSVDLTGLRSPTVDAEGSTGTLRLAFAAPPRSVSAETSTGSVDVAVPGDGTAYAVKASTSVGSTTVTVPVDSTSPRTITARSSVGTVTVRPAPAGP